MSFFSVLFSTFFSSFLAASVTEQCQSHPSREYARARFTTRIRDWVLPPVVPGFQPVLHKTRTVPVRVVCAAFVAAASTDTCYC